MGVSLFHTPHGFLSLTTSEDPDLHITTLKKLTPGTELKCAALSEFKAPWQMETLWRGLQPGCRARADGGTDLLEQGVGQPWHLQD